MFILAVLFIFFLDKRFENPPECIRDARAFCERYISEIKYGRLSKQRSVRYVVQYTHPFLHLLPPTPSPSNTFSLLQSFILYIYLYSLTHSLTHLPSSLSPPLYAQCNFCVHTCSCTHTHTHTHTHYLQMFRSVEDGGQPVLCQG